MLAFQNEKVSQFLIESIAPQMSPAEKSALLDRLTTIRDTGIEVSDSDRVEGLTDFSCPILDSQGCAAAALTVPFLKFLNRGTKAQDVHDKLLDVSKTVSTLLSGTPSP